jgi:hypothetical protein
MPACATSPENKKEQIRIVGNDLLKHYGKKKFYTAKEVQSANQRQKIDLDLVCWSHAFFNSHEDFDHLHASWGETCDYLAMKRDMAQSVIAESSWLPDFDFDFDLSWLELPDIDWGSLLDGFDLF